MKLLAKEDHSFEIYCAVFTNDVQYNRSQNFVPV